MKNANNWNVKSRKLKIIIKNKDHTKQKQPLTNHLIQKILKISLFNLYLIKAPNPYM